MKKSSWLDLLVILVYIIFRSRDQYCLGRLDEFPGNVFEASFETSWLEFEVLVRDFCELKTKNFYLRIYGSNFKLQTVLYFY